MFHVCLAAGEVNVFDTRYDVQWVVDGRLSGEPISLLRTELFRKKPVVTKPIIKAWLPEVASCEVIQVLKITPQQALLSEPTSSSLEPHDGHSECICQPVTEHRNCNSYD